MLMNVNAMVSQFHRGIPFGDVSAINRLACARKMSAIDQRGRLLPYPVKRVRTDKQESSTGL